MSQVVPYPWNTALPLLAEYQAAMKKLGVADLSYGSLEGYISTKVLVEGIKRAGPNPTPEAVKKALENFKTLNLGGISIRYSPADHQGLTFSELSMLRKDGGFVR